jgi:superfamily II DNA or RNA helicase
MDRRERFYPFFQLSDEGVLSDAFCTCDRGEKCKHLSAALERIGVPPLHVRFRQSLWYALTEMASRRHGYETNCLEKKGRGMYFIRSKTGKKLFSLSATNETAKKRIEELVARRIVETEETSLKFSNLSSEEIANWKEGNPSSALLYELSFWSDLGKWLEWMADEKKSYQITFKEEKEGGLPYEIKIDFQHVQLTFYLSFAHWPAIIPSLRSVQSPLEVELGHHTMKIHYDPIRRALHVIDRGEEEKTRKGGIEVGEWLYQKGKFVRQHLDPFQGRDRVEADAIAELLNRSGATLQPWLDVPLHLESIPARYHLFLDEEYRLHCELYIHTVGDCRQAQPFFPWIYLSESGFWKLEGLMFQEQEKIVPKEEVAEFVNRHRYWLHQFREFRTHLGSLESHLTYLFTPEGDLRFDAQLDFPQQLEGVVDFDEWIYLKGEGFYMKSRSRLPLHPGLIIAQQEIGSFLASHKEDLEQVTGFFAARCPILKAGLRVQVTEKGQIGVIPEYELAPDLTFDQIQFFGDFLYVKGEGFSELAPELRLPERFRTKVLLTPQQEAVFFAYEFEAIKPLLFQVDRKLLRPKELFLQIRSLQRSGSDLHLDAVYRSELGKVDLFTLWDAMHDKRVYLFSEAGLIALKEARFGWLRFLPRSRLDRKKRLVKLTTLEWMRLSTFEGVEPFAEEVLRSPALPDLGYLKSTLRPYQELGTQWLWSLYSHGLSGLLCDDMGLGKTHQTMALLAAVMQEDPVRAHKYLVVCPTSVIYHWEQLLARFLPVLRVRTYYGLTRTLDQFEERYDLLLTSYGILRMGNQELSPYSFKVAIFDEIQVAKNHVSQTHKSLRRISAQMRIGLTGTPIENRLRELKSLMDLVLPGYLPPDSIFRELFLIPIEKQHDEEKKILLAKVIKPFLLRRKKSEVLTDLPEKSEEIAYCDLSEEQHKLYQQAAHQMRSSIYDELKEEGKPISYVHIFSILSTLKQICDHPSLYLGDIKNFSAHQSGKWDLFVELLSEARGSGQKVVVFSQYLDMLTMIEYYLRKKGIGFAGIKGSTRDRAEQLRHFRDDPHCEVFLASLLAAGVGIDLTVASVVIHYDRWWNPAKENQATDRVHRIGQSRGVQVFKLVTKNSIEEHIHSLIEKKQGLLEEVVGRDEADQISVLSREELLAIFEAIWKES